MVPPGGIQASAITTAHIHPTGTMAGAGVITHGTPLTTDGDTVVIGEVTTMAITMDTGQATMLVHLITTTTVLMVPTGTTVPGTMLPPETEPAPEAV